MATDTARIDKRVPREGTARGNALEALRAGGDVTIAALYEAAFPGRPMPSTTRLQQQALAPVLRDLRAAGWKVEIGVARRSYRMTDA
jgi:hypothetical protein